jgi:hypothetical protein
LNADSFESVAAEERRATLPALVEIAYGLKSHVLTALAAGEAEPTEVKTVRAEEAMVSLVMPSPFTNSAKPALRQRWNDQSDKTKQRRKRSKEPKARHSADRSPQSQDARQREQPASQSVEQRIAGKTNHRKSWE